MGIRSNVRRGIASGFVATTVVLLLALTRSWIPQLDLLAVLDWVADGILSEFGLPVVPFAGVALHYLIGTLWWGAVFGIVEPIIPGERFWLKGVYFGAVAGLLVLLMVMPLAGAGYLGMHVSLPAPLVTMIVNLVYGVVLALTYDGFSGRGARG
jgi:hypothetical protein